MLPLAGGLGGEPLDPVVPGVLGHQGYRYTGSVLSAVVGERFDGRGTDRAASGVPLVEPTAGCKLSAEFGSRDPGGIPFVAATPVFVVFKYFDCAFSPANVLAVQEVEVGAQVLGIGNLCRAG